MPSGSPACSSRHCFCAVLANLGGRTSGGGGAAAEDEDDEAEAPGGW